MIIKTGIFSLLLTLSMMSLNSSSNDQPVELGKVKWLRDLDQGIAQARQQQKPVFLLFQEVPGCSTCRNYGQGVLSHPLIVEAIESLFVPVAIFNNKGGKDAQVLREFDEPSWNNPVVRIINSKKDNIIPRINRDYSKLGIVQAMIVALKSQFLAVPPYLSLMEEELLAERRGTEEAVFSMYCFWSGEQKLGNIEGVVETHAGFMKGREVVAVKYDPMIISYEELLNTAKSSSCASHVYTLDEDQKRVAAKAVGPSAISPLSNFRLDKDPKYYLSQTAYRFVPMTPLQATRVNSKLANRQSPRALLSPRQQQLVKHFEQNGGKGRNVVEMDILKAWKQVEKILEGA